MSRLDELIQELCPDGVEYGRIGDLVEYEQPSKYIVSSTNYNDDYAVPVLTAGQSFILGYTDETEGVCEASVENPVIIFDDFTGAFKWVDFPFKVKSSAMKILNPKEDVACFRYVFHLMGWLNYSSSEHKRLWIGIYSAFEVPVPPLEVQQEIVRILDKFMLLRQELSEQLSAELTARKKQYEHYRDELLTFGDDVPTEKLRNVVEFRNGKGHEKDIVVDGKYIVVNSKFISTNGDVIKYSNKQICPLYSDDILMVMSDLPNGRALARCFLVDKDDKYTLNQRIGAFHVKCDAVQTKFLFYVLNRNRQLLAHDNGVDQTNLKKDDILNILVPIPDIDEQNRIIYIMDCYNSLCADMEKGLPAEIEARTKQYEFYRDKLLTFKRKEVV